MIAITYEDNGKSVTICAADAEQLLHEVVDRNLPERVREIVEGYFRRA